MTSTTTARGGGDRDGQRGSQIPVRRAGRGLVVLTPPAAVRVRVLADALVRALVRVRVLAATLAGGMAALLVTALLVTAVLVIGLVAAPASAGSVPAVRDRQPSATVTTIATSAGLAGPLSPTRSQPLARSLVAARGRAPAVRTVTAEHPASVANAAAGCPLPSVLCDIGGLLLVESGQGWVVSQASQDLQDLAMAPFAAVTLSFAKAAVRVLSWVADEFLVHSTVDLSQGSKASIWGVTSGLASVVAVLLLVWAAGSTAWTADGSRLATALVGLGKLVLITAMIVTVTQMALTASDDITRFIVDSTLGQNGLRAELANMFSSLDPATETAMLLVFALIALLSGLAIMLEMIFRHAAILLVVYSSPITAAGSILEATASWWSRARTALIALILMKPTIALVFAIGFTSLSSRRDPYTVLAGLLTVVLAAFAWPVLARFLTFTSVGGGSGLMAGIVAAAGFSAGRNSMAGHGRSPARFTQQAEADADATVEGNTSATAQAARQTRAVTSGRAPDQTSVQTGTAPAAGAGGGSPSQAGAPAAGGALGGVMAAIQVGAIVLDHLETTAANTAAQADLGPPAHPRSTYWAAHGMAGYGAGRAAATPPPEPPDGGDSQPPEPPASAPPPVDEGT